MIVVSDTSPLTALLTVGQAELLTKLFHEVIIPPAVETELRRSHPTLPDWFPIPAYAVSNPIYLDTDKKEGYDAPLPFPEFCSQRCGASAPEAVCSADQVCLADAEQCGVPVIGKCEHRIPWKGGEAPGEK